MKFEVWSLPDPHGTMPSSNKKVTTDPDVGRRQHTLLWRGAIPYPDGARWEAKTGPRGFTNLQDAGV